MHMHVPHLLSVHLTWYTARPLLGPSCCEGLHSDTVLCVGHQSPNHYTGGGGSSGGYLFTSAHDTDHIAGESPCFVQCQCRPCNLYHCAIHPYDCNVCDCHSWCCTREQVVYSCMLYYVRVTCNADIYH